MSPSVRSLAGAAGALVSSLVLLFAFALAMLVGAANTVLGIAGIVLPTPLDLIGIVIALSMALTIALEGAMVQRHGLGIVDRGGPVERTGRYLLIGLTSVAALITIARFLWITVPYAFRTRSATTLALATLLVVAVVAVLYRTVVAATSGYESGSVPRSQE